MRNFLVAACLLVCVQTVYSQTSYTWNGSASTAWNTPSNWTPAGIPGTTDNITIVTGSNLCLLNANATINNITVNSGQLNLNGFTLTAGGVTATFNAGLVTNGTITVPNANTTVFGNGPMTMNCKVNITTGWLTIRNTTFQGVTNLTKTGSSNDQSYGGNTFNGMLTVNNTGTGYLLLGNSGPDIYNAPATFNNTGSSNLYVAHSNSGHTFNAPVTFNNAPATNNGIFVSAYSTNTIFNDSITVTSTNGQGVYFCNGNNAAVTTLAAGKPIVVGPAGFSTGTLSLRQFKQASATAQNFAFTGTASLVVGPSSIMGGDLTYSGPGLFLNGCTYGGTLNLTKTGANNDFSNGNNIFNGVTTITNAGSGYVVLADNNPDVYNTDAIFNNTGSSNLYVAHNSAGNFFNGISTFNNAPSSGTIYIANYSAGVVFNGNIVMTSASGSGIYFCNSNATATVTLAAGKTIGVGSGGFSAGTLSFRQFTQVGATAQNLPLTGSARMVFTANTQFDGDLTAVAPAIFLNGATFNGTCAFTKTGTSGDYNNGGNIFNGVTTITNSGSSYWLLGNNSPDTWNNDVIFTDDGSERLLPCWATAGNLFNGNIYVNTSGSASGIQFCGGNSTATATLAAGKTILPGTTGLTTGYLYLKQFTQLGNVPINLTSPGSLYMGPYSNFGGSFTATAADVYVQGATYNRDATFTKTGGTSNHNNQYQNIFNSTCTINQQSNTGYIMLGYNTNDLFKDSIIVTSVGTGGIYLGRSAGAGTPTLSAGKTIVTGAAGFSAGFLYLKSFTQLGNAPINLNFTGTNTYLAFSDSSTIGGNVTSNTPGIYFNGAFFLGKVDATKTGTTNDASSGGNKFMDSVSITNSGSGNIIMQNGLPDSFYNAVHFNSNGSSYIGLGWNANGTLFDGNLMLSSTNSSTGIQFNNYSGSSSTVTAGHVIKTGPTGFSSGGLYLRRLTQLGSAPVTLLLTNTASLTMGPLLVLGGNAQATSPTFNLNGCTFNGTSDLTKTGASGDFSSGGNIFTGASTITNNGSNYWVLGNNNPDIWNSDVTFSDNGSERLLPCWGSTGNMFYGDIYVNTSGSAQGIRFCGGNNTATAVLAAGKSVYTGSGGLNAGNLVLKQFTQLGNASVNLTMGSAATYIQFGPLSAIGGDVTTTSPGLLFNGCTFSGTTTCVKTGTGNDASTGGNIFTGVAKMTNAGSGYLMFGSGSSDQFNAAATFNNTGSGNLYVAYNSANNIFGGVTTFNNTPIGNTGIYVSQNSAGSVFSDNIVVTSTYGQGVVFGGGSGASSTLAAGRTITVGAGGFSAGTLQLRQFTQTGATTQNLTLTGTGNLTFGPFSAFGGDITTVSPTMFFNGCTFDGVTTSTKNGTTTDYSSGLNFFNGVTTITNTGSGSVIFGNTNGDKFNNTATFNNAGTGNFYVAHNSSNNIFSGVVTFNNTPTGNTGMYVSQNSAGTFFANNIIVNSTNGQGVQFCSNATGTAILGSGKTISVGAGGFSAGTLLLKQFTQSGATAQTINLTGTGALVFGPSSTFGGNMTSVSPALAFNGATFNGTVNSTKNGSTNDQSVGNNIFNNPATFTLTGTGYLIMANSITDTYNDATFVQTGTGRLYPNYNVNCNYTGSIMVTAPAASGITFGNNTGTATFTGSGVQTIGITTGTPVPVFTRMIMNNTGGGVTLNTPINISKNLAFISGLLNTTSTNILTMLNASTTAAGTALSVSYVNGPMRYQKASSGLTTLNFPVGNGADCRPVILSVSHTTGNLYTYETQLFNASATELWYTMPPSVDKVSNVHYYKINRYNSAFVSQPTSELSGNQQIQIFFGANDGVTDGSKLTIVKNTYTALTSWINIGGTGAPAYSGGANLTGSVISINTPSNFNSFSTFALANLAGGMNVLPVGLLYFDAMANNGRVDLKWATSTEVNNSYYTVEKSRDGISFSTLQRVNTKAKNGNSTVTLNYNAEDARPYSGISYYRLKQTDIDGNSRYSRVVAVTFTAGQTVSVYPNPSAGTVYVSGLDRSQSNMTFEWFDVSGKLLARQTAAVNSGIARLDTYFGNGIYLLKYVTAGGSIKLQNVIIQK